jgi:hypothetical protein
MAATDMKNLFLILAVVLLAMASHGAGLTVSTMNGTSTNQFLENSTNDNTTLSGTTTARGAVNVTDGAFTASLYPTGVVANAVQLQQWVITTNPVDNSLSVVNTKFNSTPFTLFTNGGVALGLNGFVTQLGNILGVGLNNGSSSFQVINGAGGISKDNSLFVSGPGFNGSFFYLGAGVAIGTNNVPAHGKLDVWGNGWFTGSVTANSFTGDGSALTGLNASALASGTVPLAQLPATVVTNNYAGSFSSSSVLADTFDGKSGDDIQLLGKLRLNPGSILDNDGNTLIDQNGNFAGNGSGITGLNASQLSGTIPLSALPPPLIGSANLIEQRNGTTAQRFNLYTTFNDASNYKRISLYGSSGDYFIDANGAGTGTSTGDLYLRNTGTHSIRLWTGGSERWRVENNGQLSAGTDNSWDIGATGANRPRTGYFGTSVVTPLVQSQETLADTLGGLTGDDISMVGNLKLDASSGAGRITDSGGNTLVDAAGNFAGNGSGLTGVIAASVADTNVVVSTNNWNWPGPTNNIDFARGTLQRYHPTGTTGINVTNVLNFPSGQVGSVVLWIENTNTSAISVKLPATCEATNSLGGLTVSVNASNRLQILLSVAPAMAGALGTTNALFSDQQLIK